MMKGLADDWLFCFKVACSVLVAYILGYNLGACSTHYIGNETLESKHIVHMVSGLFKCFVMTSNVMTCG